MQLLQYLLIFHHQSRMVCSTYMMNVKRQGFNMWPDLKGHQWGKTTHLNALCVHCQKIHPHPSPLELPYPTFLLILLHKIMSGSLMPHLLIHSLIYLHHHHALLSSSITLSLIPPCPCCSVLATCPSNQHSHHAFSKNASHSGSSPLPFSTHHLWRLA